LNNNFKKGHLNILIIIIINIILLNIIDIYLTYPISVLLI